MITDALLNILTAFTLLWSSALPSWDLLTMYSFGTHSTTIPALDNTVVSHTNPVKLIVEWAAKYNDFIPVQEAYALMLVYILLFLACMAFRFSIMVFNAVRGSGI